MTCPNRCGREGCYGSCIANARPSYLDRSQHELCDMELREAQAEIRRAYKLGFWEGASVGAVVVAMLVVSGVLS